MKSFLHSRDAASKGAALMIVLALVVLLTGVALAYFSRTTTDRQLAQSSYNDTSADLLARSALDIVVGDFKQEIIDNPTVSRTNIQPTRYGDASIPNLVRRSYNGDPTSRTSNVSSSTASANGRSISTTRWNSHYLIPRGNPGDTSVNASPTPTFVAPDWVLVTPQGPVQAPTPAAVVIGRYAFAVYDEGGLLDMNVAGYPGWTSCSGGTITPTPSPWLVNVGRKGNMAFADLTALGTYAPPQNQIDNIVGWRNYATTQRTFTGFPNPSPSPIFPTTDNCDKQNFYGSYLLYFGDPPFMIDSLLDKLTASLYPFTSAANYAPTPAPGVGSRTDQAIVTRQQLLKLRTSLQFSQNILQYMGTFSRERNRPAPDWSGLAGRLSEGRFNVNNLALVEPNPADCVLSHGKKVGWQTGKNKNHLCGDDESIHRLFGLFWVRADVVGGLHPVGEWRYIGNRNPLPGPSASPAPIPIGCLIGPTQQNDFFQILDYALFQAACENSDPHLDKTFAIGASLIDQYDSGEACPSSGKATGQPAGCDLDWRALEMQGSNLQWAKRKNTTHTTVIKYGHGNGNTATAFGMEPNMSSDPTNGDELYDSNYNGDNPHRPTPAPPPITGGTTPTQVLSHALATVGEFGYGINTSDATLPTLKFWDSSTSPPFQSAPVLDFFSYNPISSAYPRAGIVNLYTKNEEVIAAILSKTLKTDAAANANPPSPVISATPYAGSEAQRAAHAIVDETTKVLAGIPTVDTVQQADLTRAIAGRVANRAFTDVSTLATNDETKAAVVRALAEVGQTRTWNLLIDVIAQTGKYKPNSDLSGSNFVVEGEKRYWLHIAVGRDLNADGSVDVLGSQLEEVIE